MRLDPSDLVSRLWGSSALFPENTLLPGPPDSAPPKQKATSTAAWCPSSVLRCCNAAFRNCFTVNFCPSSTQGTEGNEGNEEHRDDSLHLPQAAAWYKLSLFLFLHFTKISSNFHNFLAATFCITWNIKKHQEIMSFQVLRQVASLQCLKNRRSCTQDAVIERLWLRMWHNVEISPWCHMR